MKNDLEIRAREFATRHHAAVNHVRKYTGEPYIHHPAAVVELVRSVPHSEDMLVAAWLHDTVEDTRATLGEVRTEFGDAVAELVRQLTDVSRPEDGVRAARKALDRAHLAHASAAAKTVKLADLIDNMDGLFAHAPKFAKVYIAEAALLVEVLREGDATLWRMADEAVRVNQAAIAARTP